MSLQARLEYRRDEEARRHSVISLASFNIFGHTYLVNYKLQLTPRPETEPDRAPSPAPFGVPVPKRCTRVLFAISLCDTDKMKQSRPHHVFHVVTYRMANYSDPIALVRAANALLDGALLNGQPYIRSIKGGKQHSPQGMAEGMQVVFVIEFESEADRDYWVYTDPAYKVFKAVEQRVGVESKLVFDFTDSKY